MSNSSVNNLVSITKTLFTQVDSQDVVWNRLFFDNISYETAAGYMIHDEEQYQHYSSLECKQMAEAIGDIVCDWDEYRIKAVKRGKLNVFSILARTTDLLLKKEKTVVCQYNKLIPWRSLVKAIGEELPVAAMYAQVDIAMGNTLRNDFRWDFVIGHNNQQLNSLVRRGISDHHFHLFASLPYFQVSWINLMNTICDNVYENRLCEIERQNEIPLEQDYIDSILQNGTDVGVGGGKRFIIHRLQAAVIRFYLCVRLGGYAGNWSYNFYSYNYVITLLRDEERLLLSGPDLQKEITSWNIHQNRDYALSLFGFFPKSGDDLQNIFCGERWLQYNVLRDIYTEPQRRILSREEHNLFYAYLCLKNELRKQMVQVNERVGFDNFQVFEQRKGFFFPPNSESEKLSVQLAVREPLRTKNYLEEIEVRISPATTPYAIYKRIKQIDEAICGLQLDSANLGERSNREDYRERYYYVMHFIKRPDHVTESLRFSDLVKESINQAGECRHYQLRNSLRIQGNALLALREQYPVVASRIHGIDAASQEIGCRPEVFATLFRELGDHTETQAEVQDKQLPILHKTYHAGEDFLDVIDGLRAIDEAIYFLNLDCGDRIGHAIALGINSEEWYEGKRYQVSITVQDYIDNLAWMYHAMLHYKIDEYPSLKANLEEQFNHYFREVYLNYLDEEKLNIIMERAEARYKTYESMRGYRRHTCKFDIQIYYKAWCLRGDEPELYKNGFYNPIDVPLDNRDYHYTNWLFPKDFEQRFIPECAILYYGYHYSAQIKAAGRRRISVPIRKDYAKVCTKIQECMRNRIANYGIGIETNPSSNVLISTFREYNKHPIYRFYNKHLVPDLEQRKCAQLNVSINTDDNGVFFTSLENEYALMARAMELVCDEEGRSIYQKSDIYDWLDEIRRMGNEQGF